MADEMAVAAQASGCTHTVQFKQTRLLENHAATRAQVDNASGICYGLSFVWMEYKARENYDRFFDDVNAWSDPSTRDKAARIYLEQREGAARWARECGLAATGDEGEFKTKQSLHVSMDDDMETLAKWLGKSMGERFFLIETGAHVMAGSGNKLGRLQFFDPNFGVVQSFRCSTMSKFFKAFFSAARVRDHYFRAGGQKALTVTKFKRLGA